MEDLFFSLLLISILLFIISLIKPIIFNKIFGNNVTRKITSKYFGSAIIVFFILFIIVLEPINKPGKEMSNKKINKTIVQEKRIDDNLKKSVNEKTVIKEEPILKNITGIYKQYTYSIIKDEKAEKQIATFQPFLPRDDNIVLGAINNVTIQFFGSNVLAGVKPTLENLEGGANVILFNTPTGKYYYLLFKEDNGDVSSLSFWKN